MGNEQSSSSYSWGFTLINETDRDLVLVMTDDPNVLLMLSQYSKTTGSFSANKGSVAAAAHREYYENNALKQLSRAWVRMETVPAKKTKTIDMDTKDNQASATVYAKRAFSLPGYLLVAYQKKLTRGMTYRITEADCKAAPEYVLSIPSLKEATKKLIRKEQTY
jgi:hypothetical protein